MMVPLANWYQSMRNINDLLQEDYFTMPATEDECLTLADETERRWQRPNAYAAADGKHIAVYHLSDSGATFYNYIDFYSIALLACVHYRYRFLYADIGCQGHISDSEVDRNSSFARKLSSNEMN